MTDLPDADAAWITFNTRNGGMTRYADNSNERDVFDAGFAAASGPWAEHLDAAKAELTDEERSDLNCDCVKYDGSHYDSCFVPVVESMLAGRLLAALARNAELKKWQANHGDCQTRILIAESDGDEYQAQRDALRAELDNLRETLAQKIEAHMRSEQIRVPEYETGLRRAAALVRGSDDE